MARQGLRDRPKDRSQQRVSAAMVGAAVLVCLSLPAPAGAAPLSLGRHVDLPGRLVFVNRPFDGSPSTIWTVLPGSSNATEIAHASVPIIAPTFSPSGEEIAFDRDADYLYNDARDKLVIASADGSTKRIVRSACSGDCHWIDELDWAPDGQTILMWRCLGVCPKNGYHSFYAVWSIRTDGTDLRQLSFPGTYTHTNKLNDHNPDVAPDGSSFAFDRLDDATGRFTIEIAPITGGDATPIPLPDRLNPGDPTWTPDGSKILFQSPADPTYDRAINFYSVNPDGTDLQQITHYHVSQGQHFGGLFHPSFSPDGRYIAATHNYTPSGFSYLILTPDGQLVARIPIEQNANEIDWGSAG